MPPFLGWDPYRPPGNKRCFGEGFWSSPLSSNSWSRKCGFQTNGGTSFVSFYELSLSPFARYVGFHQLEFDFFVLNACLNLVFGRSLMLTMDNDYQVRQVVWLPETLYSLFLWEKCRVSTNHRSLFFLSKTFIIFKCGLNQFICNSLWF